MANFILPEREAKRLLDELKIALVREIELPRKGQKISFNVKAIYTDDIFTITIFRGSINFQKMNYGARIKLNNIPLLELHVNAGNRHINPDGGEITGSHWHIYKEGYGLSYAFPATEITDSDFVMHTIRFLEKFNVIAKPSVTEVPES